MQEREDTYMALEKDVTSLESQLQELRNKVEVIEKREAEKRNLEEKRRKEEIDFLKYQGQHLEAFLKQLGAGK